MKVHFQIADSVTALKIHHDCRGSQSRVNRVALDVHIPGIFHPDCGAGGSRAVRAAEMATIQSKIDEAFLGIDWTRYCDVG